MAVPMFGVTSNVKRFFFDRAVVRRSMDVYQQRALGRAGGYIRKTARSRLKSPGKRAKGRARVSQPGNPPFVHSKDSTASLKNILFAWDPRTKSVVVGPVRLNMVHAWGGSMQGGVVPGVLEFGGTLGIPEWQGSGGRWFKADLRSGRRLAGRPRRLRMARYKKRPYMGPALQEAISRNVIPQAWQTAY